MKQIMKMKIPDINDIKPFKRMSDAEMINIIKRLRDSFEQKEKYKSLDDILNDQSGWPINATAVFKVEELDSGETFAVFFKTGDEMMEWLTNEVPTNVEKQITMYRWELGPKIIGTIKIGK